MKQILATATSILLSIKLFMTSLAGYFFALMSIFLGMISENSHAFMALFIAIFLDMVWGIAASVKQKLQIRTSWNSPLLSKCQYIII